MEFLMGHLPYADSKFAILAGFWDFLKTRKQWWVGSIVFIMLLMSMLILQTEGSADAPFIYTLS
jgi:hypothetical protein